jgi:hypothetical protein
MKSAGLLSLLLVTLAWASPATAGGYMSIGIGEGADLQGDLAGQFDTDDSSSSGRLAIGQRTGPIAVEAALFGTEMYGLDGDFSTVSLGVDVKYFYGLGANFELFGKGGLNKTWLVGDGQSTDMAGRGKQLGLGVQYRFTTGLIGQAALWLEASRTYVTLDGDTGQTALYSHLEGEIDMINLGVSFGL